MSAAISEHIEIREGTSIDTGAIIENDNSDSGKKIENHCITGAGVTARKNVKDNNMIFDRYMKDFQKEGYKLILERGCAV